MPNTRRERRDRAAKAEAGGGNAAALPRTRRFLAAVKHPENIKAYIVAIAGGVCGALAFEPWKLIFLAPFAPLCAFLAARRAPTPGAAFRRLVVYGLIFNYGALQWLRTIGDFAPIPFLASVGIVLLALYAALYLAIGGWAVRKWAWPTGPGAQFTVFASAWLIAEWLRTLGRLAMPLAQLGHTWAIWPLAIQPAQFVGEIGISGIILWLAGLIFYWGLFLRSRRGTSEFDRAASHTLPSIGRGLMPTLAFLVLPFACLLLLSGWKARLAAFAERPESQPLRVVIIQPNINQHLKLASYAHHSENVAELLQDTVSVLNEAMVAGLQRPGLDRLMFETAYHPEGSAAQAAAQRALRENVSGYAKMLESMTSAPLNADLVILPETAFVEMDFAENPDVLARVGRMSLRAGAPILVGAGRRLINAEGKEEVFNSAYVMRPDGGLDEKPYDKMRLVPFGEALPYFDAIPFFQENIVGIASFTEGRDYTLFDIPAATGSGEPPERPLKLGALICFESTFSSAAREFVLHGADVLSVITNDGWYGMSAGAAAHHHLSYLRAVETRRFVLRCANTGISSIIAPTGENLGTLPLGVHGTLRAAVVPKTNYRTTMFTRFGNAWLAVPMLVILAAAWRRRMKIPPA